MRHEEGAGVGRWWGRGSALVRHEGRSGVGRGCGRGSALVRHEEGVRGRALVGQCAGEA